MKFVIDGVAHDAVPLDRMTPTDMLELKRQTGMGTQQMIRRLQEADRLAWNDDGDDVIVLPAGQKGDMRLLSDSVPHLTAFLACFWMSRRLAGERTLTYADAINFQFNDLDLDFSDEVDDDAPEEGTPDPPAPAASAPDDEAAGQ
jgi:hypothetical protein